MSSDFKNNVKTITVISLPSFMFILREWISSGICPDVRDVNCYTYSGRKMYLRIFHSSWSKFNAQSSRNINVNRDV